MCVTFLGSPETGCTMKARGDGLGPDEHPDPQKQEILSHSP